MYVTIYIKRRISRPNLHEMFAISENWQKITEFVKFEMVNSETIRATVLWFDRCGLIGNFFY